MLTDKIPPKKYKRNRRVRDPGYHEARNKCMELLLQGKFESALEVIKHQGLNCEASILYHCLVKSWREYENHGLALMLGKYLYNNYKSHVKPMCYYAKVLIESNVDANIQDAIALINHLIKTKKNRCIGNEYTHTKLNLLKCKAFANLRNHSDAETLYQSLLKDDPSAKVHHQYAIYMEIRGKNNLAVESYRLSYQKMINDNYWKGLIDYGVLLQIKYGEYEESIEVLNTAIKVMEECNNNSKKFHKPQRDAFYYCYNSLYIAHNELNQNREAKKCYHKISDKYAPKHSLTGHAKDQKAKAKYKNLPNGNRLSKQRTALSFKGKPRKYRNPNTHFKTARVLDPERDKKNHPDPTAQPPKVFLGKNGRTANHANAVRSSAFFYNNHSSEEFNAGLRRRKSKRSRNKSKTQPRKQISSKPEFIITYETNNVHTQHSLEMQNIISKSPPPPKTQQKKPKKQKQPLLNNKVKYIKQAVTKGLNGLPIENKAAVYTTILQSLGGLSNNKLKAKQTQLQIATALSNSVIRTTYLFTMYFCCKKPSYAVNLNALASQLTYVSRQASQPRPLKN